MRETLNPAVASVLKRLHYPLDVILRCVRWYIAYPLSLRHLEEIVAERAISVITRLFTGGRSICCLSWRTFRRSKRQVVRSWRMDEPYIIVEQDHRAVKRRTMPMLGFKDLGCARILLSGIELMHTIRKGQMQAGSKGRTPAQQFYSLAA